MKKRLIVLGGGAHTIPSYRAMLKLIAGEYDLILLSEFHLDKKLQVEEYIIRSVPAGKRRWRELLFFLMVVKTCFAERPHIIHSHSTYPSGVVAVIAGWLFRIPVVVCLDAAEGSGVPEINFGDLLNARRAKLNRWVLNKAAAVTTLTRFQCEEVCNHLHFKNTIHVVPRGVDSVHYLSGEREQVKAPIRFLSVAYLHPVKDHTTMLHAFQLISQHVEASLTLVGEDYENGNIKALARELGIEQKIMFAGFVPHDRILDYYHQSDIFLHTSLFESQAMAVVEAMASGVLVCGTHVGIMADLSGECCITVSVRDYQLLAHNVLELIRTPSEQERLRTNALKWVNMHSLQWTTDQYFGLYKGLIG